VTETTPTPVLAYPDAELVTMAVHDVIRTSPEGLPTLVVDTFLRSGWTPPLVMVNRIGGSPDQWDVTDYAIVRCAYYGAKRMDAWDLAARGEATMVSYRGRSVSVPEYGEDAMILIDSVDIAVGGQQLLDEAPEDRRVVKDFVIGLRRAYYLLG
jgi:hypothetical protein